VNKGWEKFRGKFVIFSFRPIYKRPYLNHFFRLNLKICCVIW